eukprot:scaffold24674_cov50-Cyclotella_meneghiniana.AAC.4
MVEVRGGWAVGGRSNHGRHTTPQKLEGRLEKAEAERGEREPEKTSPHRWRGPVTFPLIS